MLFSLIHQDPLDRELEELDYELRVQGITDTSSFHGSGSGLELHRASAMGQLEHVRFLVEKKDCNPNQMFQVPSFMQLEIFPLSTKQENNLADMGVIRLTCGDHQFQVKFLFSLNLLGGCCVVN